MRSVYLFTIVFIICLSANAQLKRNPHFISINGGISMPVGEYKSFDTAYVSSAKAGRYFGLEGALYVTKFLGFGTNIGAFINPVDEKELAKEFGEQYINNRSITINSDEWLNGYAMLGMYITIPIKKLRLDFKFLGGAVNSEQPLVEVIIDEQGGQSVIVNKSTDALAFGVNYGAHLRIPIISKLYLRLNVETFTSLPELKKQTENLSTGDLSKEKFEQTISVLNAGVGLTFSF
jgi:hypothetical protein